MGCVQDEEEIMAESGASDSDRALLDEVVTAHLKNLQQADAEWLEANKAWVGEICYGVLHEGVRHGMHSPGTLIDRLTLGEHDILVLQGDVNRESAQHFAEALFTRGLRNLVLVVPEGNAVEVLTEEEMNTYGWRKVREVHHPDSGGVVEVDREPPDPEVAAQG
jgi:hypothetical protein